MEMPQFFSQIDEKLDGEARKNKTVVEERRQQEVAYWKIRKRNDYLVLPVLKRYKAELESRGMYVELLTDTDIVSTALGGDVLTDHERFNRFEFRFYSPPFSDDDLYDYDAWVWLSVSDDDIYHMDRVSLSWSPKIEGKYFEGLGSLPYDESFNISEFEELLQSMITRCVEIACECHLTLTKPSKRV